MFRNAKLWVCGLAFLGAGAVAGWPHPLFSQVAREEVRLAARSAGGVALRPVRTRSPLPAGFSLTLRRQAERLHGTPSRWPDAAVLHVYAARMSEFTGPDAADDLMLAANLFLYDGENDRACAALEKASDVYFRAGYVRASDFAYRSAGRFGPEGCSLNWHSLFDGLVIPAPARVIVAEPVLNTLDLEEAPLRAPDLVEPRLSPPPIAVP
ncbi:MAG: hypothetical protein ACE5HQ_10160 [Gemmatimonadota bacterium]